MSSPVPALFLDRDGVLNEDRHLITRSEDLVLLPGVADALAKAAAAGFKLVVVSNQPVVARGLLDEAGVRRLHRHLQAMLEEKGAPRLDGWNFCPHHPEADLPAYRIVCECRKPRPGMLLQAAVELGIDLPDSFMIGDRISDVIAGSRAGCRTIHVHTGRQVDQPIRGVDPADLDTNADHVCRDLTAAVEWILKQ